MNKEQFIALGFTDEQAEKAAAASQDELKGFVPKVRFDEVNTAKKKAEDDLKDRDTQLETLKKSTGDAAELQAQITKLQTENQAAAEKHATELKDLTLTNAIKSVLTGKVHDEALVAGLFDRSKLVVDGDKVVGLDDQLKGLKETKDFLFKPEGGNGGGSGFRVGGSGGSGTGAASNEQLASIFGNTQK